MQCRWAVGGLTRTETGIFLVEDRSDTRMMFDNEDEAGDHHVPDGGVEYVTVCSDVYKIQMHCVVPRCRAYTQKHPDSNATEEDDGVLLSMATQVY